jgi:hypothetical protein
MRSPRSATARSKSANSCSALASASRKYRIQLSALRMSSCRQVSIDDHRCHSHHSVSFAGRNLIADALALRISPPNILIRGFQFLEFIHRRLSVSAPSAVHRSQPMRAHRLERSPLALVRGQRTVDRRLLILVFCLNSLIAMSSDCRADILHPSLGPGFTQGSFPRAAGPPLDRHHRRHFVGLFVGSVPLSTGASDTI